MHFKLNTKDVYSKLFFIKVFILSLVFISTTTISNAQNCGSVVSFSANIVNNNNGTSTYTFSVGVAATSGGSKSVNITILCTAAPNTPFVSNQCRTSFATTTIYTFGPFTAPTCTGTINLNWAGYTTANCGGTTCDSQNGVPLPVKLSSFSASQKEDYVVLNWETSSEINNDKFIVERSSTDFTYISIGEVKGNGDSKDKIYYEFIDNNPNPGNSYYRLKQVDFDGKVEYSHLVTLDFLHDEKFLVFPTVLLDNNLSIIRHGEEFSDALINIYSMEGQLLYSTILEDNDNFTFAIPDLKMGYYVVKIVSGNSIFQKMLLKPY